MSVVGKQRTNENIYMVLRVMEEKEAEGEVMECWWGKVVRF